MAMNMLAIMQNLKTFGNGALAFFQNFEVIFAVEIILVFAMLYLVCKVLRENEATKWMFIYWGVLLVGACIRIFAPDLMSNTMFFFYVLLVSSLMLIMFNVEVKKYFWDVHSSKRKATEKSSGGGTEVVSQAETERCMSSIIKALQNMSKNNVGALIVLSKGSLPKQVLQSGVNIDSEISTQLIEGVFFPKAPLHDGAMVIHGHKIQSAGCFLPLTQKTSYPKEYGTRHRAAIGITEVANVISLVVSEETGIISIVKQGAVTRYADYDMLVDALKDYYWHEIPLSDRKRR